MPQPPEYVRVFNFTDFSTVSPSEQQPGVQLDAEFNAIKGTADQVRLNIAKIQSDDGSLANGIVRSANLSSEIIVGFDPPAQWEAGVDYLSTSAVFHSGKLYKAKEAHTSEVPFDEDKWDVIADFAGLTTEAGHWANYPVDQLVPEGDGVDDFSALHHNTKAQEAKNSAETDAASAATDANAASDSADAAATSESNASASESASATYASNAAASAADANDSAVSAEDSAAIATAAEEGAMATTTSPGVARLATQAIAEDGTNNTRIMTPKRVVDHLNHIAGQDNGIAPLNGESKIPVAYLYPQIEWLDRPYAILDSTFISNSWFEQDVAGDGLVSNYPDAQNCKAVLVNFYFQPEFEDPFNSFLYARTPDGGGPPSFNTSEAFTGYQGYMVGGMNRSEPTQSTLGQFWVGTAAGSTYQKFWFALYEITSGTDSWVVRFSVNAFARY